MRELHLSIDVRQELVKWTEPDERNGNRGFPTGRSVR